MGNSLNQGCLSGVVNGYDFSLIDPDSSRLRG